MKQPFLKVALMRPIHPWRVMIPAIKKSFVSFTLIHNHPSGDPTQSQQGF